MPDEQATKKTLRRRLGCIFGGIIVLYGALFLLSYIAAHWNGLKTVQHPETGFTFPSPEEIEDVVEQLPEVAQAAVVGVPDELLGEAIAAFVVLLDGAELTVKQVLKACHAGLPRFKMPTHVRFVETLPRTQTGKLRRSELKEWFAAGEQA